MVQRDICEYLPELASLLQVTDDLSGLDVLEDDAPERDAPRVEQRLQVHRDINQVRTQGGLQG